MVTAMAWPRTRISSGSSTASESEFVSGTAFGARRVTSARTLDSPAILADAFALRELIELLKARARMGRIKLPNDLAVRLDRLRAAFFIVANIDGMLGGAGDARFDEMLP